MKSNKSHHKERVGGCRQQDLQRQRWDLHPPIGAQTMAAIIRVSAVHPKPCWEQVLTEAGSCISHSCCSSPSPLFFPSFFYSRHFVKLPSETHHNALPQPPAHPEQRAEADASSWGVFYTYCLEGVQRTCQDLGKSQQVRKIM